MTKPESWAKIKIGRTMDFGHLSRTIAVVSLHPFHSILPLEFPFVIDCKLLPVTPPKNWFCYKNIKTKQLLFVSFYSMRWGFELMTPGLPDQCSTTKLRVPLLMQAFEAHTEYNLLINTFFKRTLSLATLSAFHLKSEHILSSCKMSC